MNKILNIISELVALVLSIGLFFAICLFLIFDFLPKIINKENIEIIVESYDTKEILGEDNNLINSLYKLADENNIDRNIIDGIINSKEVKEMLGSYSGEMVEAILYDGKVEMITSNKIVQVVENVLDRTASENGYTLTVEQKDIVLKTISEKSQEIVNLIPTYEQVIDGFTENELQNIRTLFGITPKIVLGIIIILIVIIIALVRWSTYKFAIWTGVTTIIAGVIFIASSDIISSIIDPTYIGTLPYAIINLLENNIFKLVTNTGMIVTVIGVVQVGYYLLMKKIKKGY